MNAHRHKKVRTSRVSKATVVAGKAGPHVLVELKGPDGNRLMCGPRGAALELCANILNGYVDPAEVEVGEALGVRRVSDVYALRVESGVVSLGFFADGDPVLDPVTQTFGPRMVWLRAEVCPKCRVRLEPRTA